MGRKQEKGGETTNKRVITSSTSPTTFRTKSPEGKGRICQKGIYSTSVVPTVRAIKNGTEIQCGDEFGNNQSIHTQKGEER